jgi:hypothetical protein
MSFNPGGGGIANANDVALSNPSANQVLTYNSGLGKWQNVTPSNGSAGVPTWYVNVKDFGAVGNGTTDDSTAIANARDAVIASRGGYSGNVPQKPVLLFPPGQYKVTQPDALWDQGSEMTEGLIIQGYGKRVSRILFQPVGGANSDPTQLNLMTWLDSNNSGGRMRNIRFRDMSFDCNNANASFLYMFSTSTAASQDVQFWNCEWTGNWNRGIGLDGDSTANLNSEMKFDSCGLGNSCTFGDAFLRSALGPTYYAQEDQFLNYWFYDCKFEYGGGDLLHFEKGGSINVIGGSWIGIDTTNDYTFIRMGKQSHSDSVLRLLVQGVRFELRSQNQKVIDCGWHRGNITFISCHDSSAAYRVLGNRTTPGSYANWDANGASSITHAYDWTYNGGGPVVRYMDCELMGKHKVTTNSSVSNGKIVYDGCRFLTETTATTMLSWTSGAPKYVYQNNWNIADTSN